MNLTTRAALLNLSREINSALGYEQLSSLKSRNQKHYEQSEAEALTRIRHLLEIARELVRDGGPSAGRAAHVRPAFGTSNPLGSEVSNDPPDLGKPGHTPRTGCIPPGCET